MPDFSDAERRILKYFEIGSKFNFQDKEYTVTKSGKPTCPQGEPKTDIYIKADSNEDQKEIKISYKKENADFIENKMNAERAEQLFGDNWQEIIERSTYSVLNKFNERPLIYKQSLGRVEKGAITLGWKFELMNKQSGDLSGKMDLTIEQVHDVYAGNNLSEEKKNASVEGDIIENSGVANYILVDNTVDSAQSVVDRMIAINDYINEHPDIYFACKALNYRTFKEKWDGDRPLSVQVNWKEENGKMVSELIFDQPLKLKGNEMARRLIETLKKIGIKNTDDIDNNNSEEDKIN